MMRCWIVPGALVLLGSSAAGQTTWYVDATGTPPGSGTQGDPYTSIQLALDQPATADGDTVLVLPGVYAEFVDFGGKAVHLLAQDGPATTSIDVTFLFQLDASAVIFRNGEGPGSILEGFTVTGGTGSPDPGFSSWRGGGILAVSASPVVRGCRIEGNFADEGGGVYAESSSILLTGCEVDGNASGTGWGGAGLRFVGGTPRVEGCDVRSNGTQGFAGGGLSVDGATLDFVGGCLDANFATGGTGGNVQLMNGAQATFTGVAIQGGSAPADSGGGLHVSASTLTLADCTVSDCYSGDDHWGGALYAANSVVTVTDCVFEDNLAGRGGAIASFSSTVDVTGSRFSRNEAGAQIFFLIGQGGAVYTLDGGVTLDRCVLEDNRANFLGQATNGEGGALYGPIVAQRCTLVRNAADSGAAAWDGAFNSCVLWDNGPAPLAGPASVAWSDVQGGAAGPGNIDQDPLFFDEAGGDYHLQAGSPCIDTGDPGAPPDPDGSRADMGAFPYDPTWCPQNVVVYCTAKASSAGCLAAISTATPQNAPVSGAADYAVLASGVQGLKAGLFFYGQSGATGVPFWGGTLCVNPPLGRAPIQFSGGSTGACDGAFAHVVNDGSLSDPGPGGSVWLQAWYRDPDNGPGTFGTALSDALLLVYK